jgi:crossover junction endodeoxyribonuclease RusA
MKTYLQEARWRIKAWMPQAHWIFPDPHTKVVLAFWVYWPDRRVRDTGNLIKVLGDACQGVLLPNDRMLLPRPMDFTVDRHHPRLACRVWVHRPARIREPRHRLSFSSQA